MANDLEFGATVEHLLEPAMDAAFEAGAAMRLRAVVVKMPIFGPRVAKDELRRQVNEAFPGISVIFADHGTEIEVIHAAE